jgi:hypothetical protein
MARHSRGGPGSISTCQPSASKAQPGAVPSHSEKACSLREHRLLQIVFRDIFDMKHFPKIGSDTLRRRRVELKAFTERFC